MQTFAQQKQKYNKISKQPNDGEEYEQTTAKSSVFSSIWLKNRLLSQIFSLNLQHNKEILFFMLKKDFQYYLDNQAELVKKYNHRFLVIKDCQVVGDFDSYEEALFESSRKYELGTFLIQECTEGDSAYTQTFHSRVMFV